MKTHCVEQSEHLLGRDSEGPPFVATSEATDDSTSSAVRASSCARWASHGAWSHGNSFFLGVRIDFSWRTAAHQAVHRFLIEASASVSMTPRALTSNGRAGTLPAAPSGSAISRGTRLIVTLPKSLAGAELLAAVTLQLVPLNRTLLAASLSFVPRFPFLLYHKMRVSISLGFRLPQSIFSYLARGRRIFSLHVAIFLATLFQY